MRFELAIHARGVALACVVGVGLMALAPPSQAAPAPTQGIIYATPGCNNTISIRAVDYAGKVTGERALVRPSGNRQLIPYDVSTKPNVFLFGAFDCGTKTYRLYSQPLQPKPSATLLLDPGAGMTIVDAAWDLARDTPIVLVRDESFNYTILLSSPSGWAPIWSATQAQIGDIFLRGMESLTGREIRIFASGASGSGRWQTWIIDGQGNTFPSLSGNTGLLAVASTTLLEATAYMGPGGTWICDALAGGDVQAAASQGKCAAVPNGAAAEGAFVFAGGDARAYWLVLVSPGLPASPMRSRVSCAGGSPFSCGTPIAQQPISSPALFGQDMLSLALFDINFRRVGSTRVS